MSGTCRAAAVEAPSTITAEAENASSYWKVLESFASIPACPRVREVQDAATCFATCSKLLRMESTGGVALGIG